MSTYDFDPNWDTQAVLVEEIQRMAKRIEDLEAMLESQTAPAQPVREWVGLTDDEIFEIHKQVDSIQYLTFGKAIEAKLKEKNI